MLLRILDSQHLISDSFLLCLISVVLIERLPNQHMSSKFIISPEATIALQAEIDRYEEPLEYTKTSMAKIKQAYVELYRYLVQTASEQSDRWKSYAFAASIASDKIKLEFTPCDITQHRLSHKKDSKM